MAPGWMLTDAKADKAQFKVFGNTAAENKNIRCENNRVILRDRDEPAKSIFNVGQVRHNVMTKEEAQKITLRNYSS